ncbi:TetR/AcrR family transcriptional regulator [Ferrimonas balearica]|uniref:TetR/AcrR family transcriptional regulator n=1 Tax=Ferrimonas balearica TaxID=44012 RepID=UPI001C992BDB|nr:TetR/AcrR family transcriptional regulator [Ferrimonas balearica]MBY5991399.1 TetR/AcrR family transcriptional regulator [Ferrimonas balearica]
MTTPKQQRSLKTQQKLLDALDHCLQHKYFEQISVAEITTEAQVSVGTFYRRFKDKEALLPLLYQRFGDQLRQWHLTLVNHQEANLEAALHAFCHQTRAFFERQRHILRTVHLNARLGDQALTVAELQGRRQEYQQLERWLGQHLDPSQRSERQGALQMAVYTVVSATLDKVLYPSLTPAIASELNGAEFSDGLVALLLPALEGR